MILAFKSQHCHLTVWGQFLWEGGLWGWGPYMPVPPLLLVLCEINIMSTTGVHACPKSLCSRWETRERRAPNAYTFRNNKNDMATPSSPDIEAVPSRLEANRQLYLGTLPLWLAWLQTILEVLAAPQSSKERLPHFWAPSCHPTPHPTRLIVLNCASPPIFSIGLGLGRTSTWHRSAPKKAMSL